MKMFKFIYLIVKKKKAVIIIVLLVLLGGYGIKKYYFSNAQTTTKYVTSIVKKATIVESISGTGMVSASNQAEIKARVSSDVVSTSVSVGKEVKTGDVILTLDTTDAYKTIRDAQVGVESAKLTLKKLTQSITTSSISQAENTLTNAKNSLEKLKLSQKTNYQNALAAQSKTTDDLAKAYEDTFNDISNAYLDVPSIIGRLNNILNSYDIGKSESSIGSNYINSSALLNNAGTYDDIITLQLYLTTANYDYQTARLKYDASFYNYNLSSRYASTSTIENLLQETILTVKALSQSAKSENNFINAWVDNRTNDNKSVYIKVKEYQTSLTTDIGKLNTHLSGLLSAQRSLKDYKNNEVDAISAVAELDQNNPLDLIAAIATVNEKQADLDCLKLGVDPLDVQSQNISIKQKQNTLADALQKLEDYTIKVPFDGVVGKFDLKKGDSVSSGSAVTTIITRQSIATITLSEVDVAKIKIGQKATLTFDAFSDLTIAGTVAQVDSIGTISQGVVYYNVLINFQTQDDRIKAGMSVRADTIINSKQDVLIVPNAAVKTSGNTTYVEMWNKAEAAKTLVNGVINVGAVPNQQTVVVGLSNDTESEIITGLQEGDVVVTQTATGATASATTNSATDGGLRIPGLTGGGNFRGR